MTLLSSFRGLLRLLDRQQLLQLEQAGICTLEQFLDTNNYELSTCASIDLNAVIAQKERLLKHLLINPRSLDSFPALFNTEEDTSSSGLQTQNPNANGCPADAYPSHSSILEQPSIAEKQDSSSSSNNTNNASQSTSINYDQSRNMQQNLDEVPEQVDAPLSSQQMQRRCNDKEQLLNDLERWLLKPGKVTELRGESGSGKSQMAMWLTIRQLLQDQQVIYVNVNGGLCVDRVLQLLSAKLDCEKTIRRKLERLKVVQLHSFWELADALHVLNDVVQNENIRLVVIDSLITIVNVEVLSGRCREDRKSIQHVVQTLTEFVSSLLVCSSRSNHRSQLAVLVCAGFYNLAGPLWANRCDRRLIISRVGLPGITDDHFLLRIDEPRSQTEAQVRLKIDQDGFHCVDEWTRLV